MDGGGDDLRSEWREAVGDMRVCLHPGFGPVAGVDEVHRFAPAAGGGELAVARSGPARTPEGCHRQRRLSLDDRGQRPVVCVALDVPAGDAHQLPEPALGGRVGHLAQAEVDAFGQDHAEQANAVAARRARAQVS